MGELSWWHWLIIIAAFVLIFGAKKLPDAARGVGRSLRILKSEVAAMHEDDKTPGPSAADSTAAIAPSAASPAAANSAVSGPRDAGADTKTGGGAGPVTAAPPL